MKTLTISMISLVVLATGSFADVSEVLTGSYLPPVKHEKAHHHAEYPEQTRVYHQHVSYESQPEISSYSSDNQNYYSTSSASSYSAPKHLKHAFFYEGPQDEVIGNIRVRYEGGSGTHHDKVVFIKTPSYILPAAPEVDIQNLNSERTKIYVLVKNQEGGQEIVIPKVGDSGVTKPEVYFIKYKSRADAERQISEVQQSGRNVGVAASAVSGGSELVGRIVDNVGHSSHASHTSHSSHTGQSRFPSYDLVDMYQRGFLQEGSQPQGFVNYGKPGASGPYKK